MAETKLIRDHHRLSRNLKLNGNYISNDGGDEGVRISDDGKVGVNTNIVSPIANFEVFNANIQLDGGTTAYQSSTIVISSAADFTEDMVGGRLIFDDGTDSGVITAFSNTSLVVVSTSQTVGGIGDQRAFKVYYPSVQVDTSGSSTSLKIGNTSLSKNEIDFAVDGDFTVDAVEDIILSADGGNIYMHDGTANRFDFNVDSQSLAITNSDGKILTCFTGTPGVTSSENLTLNATDAIFIKGDYTSIQPNTKASSGTNDFTLTCSETLNLSSGAGGSDVHYGIKYTQTQTDLTGWNSVYLMYLTGGSNKTLSIDKDAKIAGGSQLKLSYDSDSYSTFDVADSSHLSITAAESGNVQLYGHNIVFGNNAGGNHTAFSINSGSGSKWSSSNGFAYIDAAGDIKLDASTGIFHFYDAGDDDDAFKITVAGGTGATTLETVSDGADGHLSIVADGDIILDADGGNITLQDGGSTYTPSAASDAVTKTYVDSNVYHILRSGFNYSSTGGTKIFVPIPSAELARDTTSILGGSENLVFIAPYDGSLEKVMVRSEEDCGSTVVGLHVGTGNTETPSATATQSVTVDMGTDDTTYTFDFASAGTNTFSAGNMILFSFTPTNDSNDTHMVMVLKFDITT